MKVDLYDKAAARQSRPPPPRDLDWIYRAPGRSRLPVGPSILSHLTRDMQVTVSLSTLSAAVPAQLSSAPARPGPPAQDNAQNRRC